MKSFDKSVLSDNKERNLRLAKDFLKLKKNKGNSCVSDIEEELKENRSLSYVSEEVYSNLDSEAMNNFNNLDININNNDRLSNLIYDNNSTNKINVNKKRNK